MKTIISKAYNYKNRGWKASWNHIENERKPSQPIQDTDVFDIVDSSGNMETVFASDLKFDRIYERTLKDKL